MAEPDKAIDVSATRRVRGSPSKLVLLLILSIGLTAICVLLALGLLPLDGEDREAGLVFGWIGTALFGFSLAVMVRRLVGWQSVVIEIAPEGIIDRRLTGERVRWDEITDVAVWSERGNSFIQLKLCEAAEARLFGSPWARFMRLLNAALGFSGLSINTAGIDIDTGTLLDVCTAYWQAHRGS